MSVNRKYNAIPMTSVKDIGGFWGKRQKINDEITINAVYNRSKETGRIDAFKLDWKPGMPNKPHKFWDSDVAKWLEAAAYSLYNSPNENLQKKVDEVISLIISAQQPDGYLNIVFTVLTPEKRWKNLRDDHELYCAGHLIEAAVALYECLGDTRLLDAMKKYVDYIDSVFGREPGKIRGYPGHQEIELALVRLYHTTKNKKYLELSEYFVNERGEDPYYFNIEAINRGENPPSLMSLNGEFSPFNHYLSNQSHLLAREMEEAVGHSVRACYFYSGMADIAMEYNDEELMDACKTLWNDIAYKKMYITGGCGSTYRNEGWTYPFDLPNETAYAETCAAIAWVYFNHRLSQTTLDGKYGDMMEKALYNGVLSGVSLKGDSFFYVNPLEVRIGQELTAKHTFIERQKFFNCSCCPPNIARLQASIGTYFYNESENDIIINVYGDSTTTFKNGTIIKQETNYPWDGDITLNIKIDKPSSFRLWIRIPEWSKDIKIKLNHDEISVYSEKGYTSIDREWNDGDKVEIMFEMEAELIYCNPKVSENVGKVAIQRGPIIYAFEGIENGNIKEFRLVSLDSEFPLKEDRTDDLDNGVVIVKAKGIIASESWDNKLYSTKLSKEKIELKAIPYYTWANRGKTSMTVWINEK